MQGITRPSKTGLFSGAQTHQNTPFLERLGNVQHTVPVRVALDRGDDLFIRTRKLPRAAKIMNQGIEIDLSMAGRPGVHYSQMFWKFLFS